MPPRKAGRRRLPVPDRAGKKAAAPDLICRCLARSLVVGSLPARPGHSRDTPVTETTWPNSRRSVLVAATWWSSSTVRVGRFTAKRRYQCGCRMLADLPGVISHMPVWGHCDKRMLGARYDPNQAMSDPRFDHFAGLLLPILQVQRIEFIDAAIAHYQDAVVRSQSKPSTAEDGNRHIDVGEIWRSFCWTVRYSESPEWAVEHVKISAVMG